MKLSLARLSSHTGSEQPRKVDEAQKYSCFWGDSKMCSQAEAEVLGPVLQVLCPIWTKMNGTFDVVVFVLYVGWGMGCLPVQPCTLLYCI